MRVIKGLKDHKKRVKDGLNWYNKRKFKEGEKRQSKKKVDKVEATAKAIVDEIIRESARASLGISVVAIDAFTMYNPIAEAERIARRV